MLRVTGASLQESLTVIWGPKSSEQLMPLDLSFDVAADLITRRRLGLEHVSDTKVRIRGLISKFKHGAGRTTSDRQFFFVNGRPCNIGKV